MFRLYVLTPRPASILKRSQKIFLIQTDDTFEAINALAVDEGPFGCESRYLLFPFVISICLDCGALINLFCRARNIRNRKGAASCSVMVSVAFACGYPFARDRSSGFLREIIAIDILIKWCINWTNLWELIFNRLHSASSNYSFARLQSTQFRSANHLKWKNEGHRSVWNSRKRRGKDGKRWKYKKKDVERKREREA